MLLTAAKNDKNEKNVFILGDIEGAVAYSIYLAVGCKYAMPTSGNHALMDNESPYWVAWVLYLSGAFLLAFDASRTVCIRGVFLLAIWGESFLINTGGMRSYFGEHGSHLSRKYSIFIFQS